MISNFTTFVFANRYPKANIVQLIMRCKNLYYKEGKPGHQQDITTGIKISPEQFGGSEIENTWILGNTEQAQYLNEQILKMSKGLHDVYLKLKMLADDKEPHAKEVVNTFKNGFVEKTRTKFSEFLKVYIEGNALTGTTKKSYDQNLASSLKAFTLKNYSSDDIYIDEITLQMVYQYELYMSRAKTRWGKSYGKGTIIEYINKLKAVITYACKLGEIKVNFLEQYEQSAILNGKELKKSTAWKDAMMWKISPDELLKIETVPIKGYGVKGDAETSTGNQYNYDLVRVRLLFLLQTWTGFAWADLDKIGRHMKDVIMTDLTGKKIILYNRAKNGELAIIPLFDQTVKLLEALEYNVSTLGSYDTYNRKIKALLTYYVIESEKESSHLGRHLCGSRMLNLGFSMEAVSRILGHTSISMTEKVYACVDVTKVLNDYDKIKLTINDLGKQIAV